MPPGGRCCPVGTPKALALGVAPGLHLHSRVIPTLSEVRGLPVPGVRGVAPHPTVRGTDFQKLLQQLMPGAGTRTTAPTGLKPPTRVQRPAVQPRAVPARPSLGPGASRPAAPQSREALTAAIRQASTTAGVEPGLSVAVARVESNLDPSARSRDGLSVGTFQVTHATAAEMRRKIARGTVERPPGTDDVALGVGYLRYLQDLFARRAHLARGVETVPVADADERRLFAVAAFNAGEGRVARAQARAAASGRDPTRFADVQPYLPAITQAYVERVTAYASQESPATAV
jgi:soluble lytic murein transglycosylase-like protein